MNWYKQSQIFYQIQQEAGIKESLSSAILAAIVMVLGGASLESAVRKSNAPKDQVEQALNNQQYMQKAQEIMSGRTEDMGEKPIAPVSMPSTESLTKQLIDHEGYVKKVYRDSKGIPTIGIGHKILPGEDFSQGISPEEAQQLFQSDIQKHVGVAKGLFPNFDSYPNYLKVALLDGVYRGEHKSNYKTTKLINQERWTEAAEEYLRNQEYIASKSQGDRHGVWQRMDENYQRLRQRGKETGN